MRKQRYPLSFYNADEEEYELEVQKYANLLIEDGDPEEPGTVGLVVVYPDTRPIRYLVTEVDEQDDAFVSRDQRIEIDRIDD